MTNSKGFQRSGRANPCLCALEWALVRRRAMVSRNCESTQRVSAALSDVCAHTSSHWAVESAKCELTRRKPAPTAHTSTAIATVWPNPRWSGACNRDHRACKSSVYGPGRRGPSLGIDHLVCWKAVPPRNPQGHARLCATRPRSAISTAALLLKGRVLSSPDATRLIWARDFVSGTSPPAFAIAGR